MAVRNKATGKYEASRLLTSIHLLVKVEADTREEANRLLKEDLKAIREAMAKGEFLEDTGYGSKAQPYLAAKLRERKASEKA